MKRQIDAEWLALSISVALLCYAVLLLSRDLTKLQRYTQHLDTEMVRMIVNVENRVSNAKDKEETATGLSNA